VSSLSASTAEREHPLQVIVIEDPESLSDQLAAWDALAVRAGRPFCSPAWMLAWWHEARTGDARLRVVLVVEQGRLIGVGPFFAQVGALGLVEMRLLAAGFCHRIGPLAAAGRETQVAAELARALAEMHPSPASVVFEGIDAEDGWPELIAAAWPSRRRPRLRTDVTMDAPVIELEGSYEDWLSRRERRFRKEARRTWNRLEEEGVSGRVATGEQAIDALLQLHYERWENRGGSNVGDEARRVILRAAKHLNGMQRLVVALLESPDGGPVAAELVLSAGDTAVFWGGGFDPRWARNAPGTQAMLFALRTLAQQGARVADLGGGEHEYKRRLADDNRPLAWRTLFVAGPRYPLIRLRLAPKHIRVAVRELIRKLQAVRRGRLRRLASTAKS
jgi:CelD/BcsL family acetyltransferase involved in cellulose biosynthesis